MFPKRLPFTTSNTHVKYFRHALALDEHRVRFKPNFWNRPIPGAPQRGTKRNEMPRPRPYSEKSLRNLEKQYTDGGDHATNVEEVWFAGAHCGAKGKLSIDSHLAHVYSVDVGGGAVKNETRNHLARIPFRWMVRQCFLLKTGILFHRELFPVFGMDPDSLWPDVKPRPPPVHHLSATPKEKTEYIPAGGTSRALVDVSDFISEEEEDLADVLSGINDMLKISKSWWILELIPQKIRFQNDEDSWIRKLS